MTTLKDAAGHVIATISKDLVVSDTKGKKLGQVFLNGDVWNREGKVGTFSENNGYVYKGSQYIGTIDSIARTVKDYEMTIVGRIEGEHVMLGGAALILLAR